MFASLVVVHQCLPDTLPVTHFKELPFNNKNATASKTLKEEKYNPVPAPTLSQSCLENHKAKDTS